jgi:hypothetical protein
MAHTYHSHRSCPFHTCTTTSQFLWNTDFSFLSACLPPLGHVEWPC